MDRHATTSTPAITFSTLSAREKCLHLYQTIAMLTPKWWLENGIAALVIQLIALIPPLFTQAIIDKIIIHRATSSLIVMTIGILILLLFSAALTWLRQHLHRLPSSRITTEQTGKAVAIDASAHTPHDPWIRMAVCLCIDLPLLLMIVAMLFHHNATLACLVVLFLGVATVLSAHNSAILAHLVLQIMRLTILATGAYFAMNSPQFSIGMLVAFLLLTRMLIQPLQTTLRLWKELPSTH